MRRWKSWMRGRRDTKGMPTPALKSLEVLQAQSEGQDQNPAMSPPEPTAIGILSTTRKRSRSDS